MPLEVKLILSSCLMLPSLVSGLLAFESVPVQLVQWLLKRENTWICHLAVYPGSHGSVSERIFSSETKGRDCPWSQLHYNVYCTFKNIFSRNQHCFGELFQKKQFELCPPPKNQREGKANKTLQRHFLKRKCIHCALQCNGLSDSFLIALYRLKGVTPPFHTSHLFFLKTRAYYVLTEHEWDPVLS